MAFPTYSLGPLRGMETLAPDQRALLRAIPIVDGAPHAFDGEAPPKGNGYTLF